MLVSLYKAYLFLQFSLCYFGFGQDLTTIQEPRNWASKCWPFVLKRWENKRLIFNGLNKPFSILAAVDNSMVYSLS